MTTSVSSTLRILAVRSYLQTGAKHRRNALELLHALNSNRGVATQRDALRYRLSTYSSVSTSRATACTSPKDW